MAAFNFHKRRTRRWWYAGTTLVVVAFFAVFFVTSSSALNASPSNFEAGDGNMTLDASGNTDWNCFQGTDGFQTSANLGPGPGGTTFTRNADCAAKSGATNSPSPNPDFEQTPGQKFDTACPTFKIGNNPPKDVWSDVAQYIEASPSLNSDNGHDIYFYGASIRPVVNGNSSGNIYFSQGTNPNGANCRTVGDVLLTFDFLGGGSKPTLHILTWQGASGSCFVGSDSPTTGCWGPSTPPTITGANSDGETNASQINGSDNALNGQTVLANGFSEIGVNLTQAIKAAGGSATCFANETWVSRSSGSSFTSSPEMVVSNSTPTCGSITIIKHTNPRGLPAQFTYTGTGTGVASSFHLNDGGYNASATPPINDVACVTTLGAPRDSTAASPCNSRTFSNLAPANYSVNETGIPTGFAFGSVSCTKNGSAVSSGSGGLTITTSTVAISLGVSETWVCTYVNNQQLGVIKVYKSSSKTTSPLSGVVFTVTKPDTSTATMTTGSDGFACIGDLPFGSYSVQETTPKSGYGIDDSTSHSVTVGTNTTCAAASTSVDTSNNTLNFTDTPLSKITVTFARFGTQTETNASIVCKNGNTVLSASPSEQGQGDSFAIQSYTAADPTMITLPANSIDLTKNAVGSTIPVQITGVTGGTPSINGAFTATVTSASTISIPVAVTTAGTGGTVNVLDDLSELFGNGTSGLGPGTYTCTVIIDP